jgi:uncharacterized protein (DUF2237 family)
MRTVPDFAAGRIAAQRYFARWSEMAKQGMKPVVISRATHPQQWAAWLAYYRSHGLSVSVDLMLDHRPEKTVPCLDPADFEPVMHIEPDRRVKD